jgi:hypothetical protein
MLVWSNEQIEQWRLKYRAYKSDTVSATFNRDVDLLRSQAQQEMLKLLNSFLDNAITLKEFNTVFQQKTHNAWKVFHLQGMSGGLFLNKLVKHVPSEDAFGHLFRLMVRVPEETQDGRRQMQAFVRFLEGLIASGHVTRAQLQPARVPFFLSAWWHIQDPERWPIFYLDVRQALLQKETHSREAPDPVEAYFEFRTRFLSLAKEIGLSSWELEHLCDWSANKKPNGSAAEKKERPVGSRNNGNQASQRQVCMVAIQAAIKSQNTTGTEGEDSNSSQAAQLISCRTHLQWFLAKLGRKVGCQIWITANDQSKVCQHERLGDLSLPSLPILADSVFQKIISQIDVLWLLDNEVFAAFEIEQTHTDVSVSLLRLYDLGLLLPNSRIRLCVVAPEDRLEKVQFTLSRPIFHGYDMRNRLALICEDTLLQHKEHILRWASSPSVLQDLTESRARKPP